jgi:hypothetical protein
MKHQTNRNLASVLTCLSSPRGAVFGANTGSSPLTAELVLHSHDPVVFGANDRLFGSCSSRIARTVGFNKAAQAQISAIAAPQVSPLARISKTEQMTMRAV